MCVKVRRRSVFKMAAEDTDFSDVLSETLSKLSLNTGKKIELKLEQEQAIKSLLNGRDVLAVLPTGFGKSLIFQVVAAVKSMHETSPCCAIIICPLKSIISDQIDEAKLFGLKAAELENPDMLTALPEDEIPDLLFASAEAVCAKGFRAALKQRPYLVHLIVVDESHTVETWTGERTKKEKAFRSAYGELAVLRSFCKQGTPYLALTGTADKTTQGTIITSLVMKKPDKIVISPERVNIRISVTKCKKKEMFSKLDWLVDQVRELGKNAPKAIIFCNMMSEMAAVTNYLMLKLGKDGYYPNTSQDQKNCLISVFHSMTWAESKDAFLTEFKQIDSTKRIVVASTALSMGVNFPDVTYVINWGPARTLLDYHQEAGRAGRDGSQAHSIVIYHGNQTAHCEADVKTFVRAKECYRVACLKPFCPDIKPLHPGHNCCTNCSKECPCKSCGDLLPFESTATGQELAAQRKRDVTPEQKSDLFDALTELQEKFDGHCSLEVHGLNSDLVTQLVDGACTIFSVKDIQEFPVFSVKVATQIHEIFQDIFADIEEMEDIPDVFLTDSVNDVDFLLGLSDDEGNEEECFDDGEREEESW